jgi:hypothetical protein
MYVEMTRLADQKIVVAMLCSPPVLLLLSARVAANNSLKQPSLGTQIFELLFVLRGNLGRNQFGLLNKGLLSKAQAGTKVLVPSRNVSLSPVTKGKSSLQSMVELRTEKGQHFTWTYKSMF